MLYFSLFGSRGNTYSVSLLQFRTILHSKADRIFPQILAVNRFFPMLIIEILGFPQILAVNRFFPMLIKEILGFPQILAVNRFFLMLIKEILGFPQILAVNRFFPMLIKEILGFPRILDVSVFSQLITRTSIISGPLTGCNKRAVLVVSWCILEHRIHPLNQ